MSGLRPARMDTYLLARIPLSFPQTPFLEKVLMKPQECSATEGQIYATADDSVELPSEIDWRSKLSVETGEHLTGSPNKSIDQIGKNCQKMSETCVVGPSMQFLDIFRTYFRLFSDILSTFLVSGLSNDLPFYKLSASFSFEL